MARRRPPQVIRALIDLCRVGRAARQGFLAIPQLESVGPRRQPLKEPRGSVHRARSKSRPEPGRHDNHARRHAAQHYNGHARDCGGRHADRDCRPIVAHEVSGSRAALLFVLPTFARRTQGNPERYHTGAGFERGLDRAQRTRAQCAILRRLCPRWSRVSPVQTALRNCTGDEGRSFEAGNRC